MTALICPECTLSEREEVKLHQIICQSKLFKSLECFVNLLGHDRKTEAEVTASCRTECLARYCYYFRFMQQFQGKIEGVEVGDFYFRENVIGPFRLLIREHLRQSVQSSTHQLPALGQLKAKTLNTVLRSTKSREGRNLGYPWSCDNSSVV